MRKLESVEKGHGKVVHLVSGTGPKTLCGWPYVGDEMVDGHPLYRGRFVDKPFNCSRCRNHLRKIVYKWTARAPAEMMENLADLVQAADAPTMAYTGTKPGSHSH